ncbi:MAG: signal recognition particle protein [Blastocatellia bacterium]|nr:signal recognition particle protein [Blastocatellia bacterium]MCS7156877.1 signal recognition particle protein [Blastocatellia bacterium]MDW8167569.1 signal recognition particle protein [Acidobacteriota bacterium]MDW8256169.1 signal recognition particle protein [Acidobacteriota bacterium]
MFDALSEKLRKVLRDLRGHGKLTEADVEAALREIRLALLEADVHFRVVKQFIERVREKALGQEVFASLSPAQQVIKIVYDELTEMLGGTSTRLLLTSRLPNIILLVGLQGSGKTTTAGKLARYLAAQGRNPLLVSADVYRPAAREQLAVIAREIRRPFFDDPSVTDPVEICRRARRHAELTGFDPVIVDTAGRLHVDEELMVELEAIKRETKPVEILLVADAMTGQDAVRSAEVFHQRIGLSGVILTKMDGDTRGGAALSIKAVTGQPIKFIGVGEKYDALEPFYPDRMASRILGMGDVLSLIERVQAEVDEREAARLQEKLRREEFTLEDFLEQLRLAKRFGSLGKIFELLPAEMLKFVGVSRITPEQMAQFERQLKRAEAIINSMTPEERRNYRLIDGSRRRRIARGSGTTVEEVNTLLKQYVEMRRMMKHLREGAFPFGKLLGKGGKKRKKKRS